MDKLKPCPFCGSNAKLMGGPMTHETYSVWCTGVGRHHMDYGFDKDTAIAAWNTRATLYAIIEAALRAQVEKRNARY